MRRLGMGSTYLHCTSRGEEMNESTDLNWTSGNGARYYVGYSLVEPEPSVWFSIYDGRANLCKWMTPAEAIQFATNLLDFANGSLAARAASHG